MEDLKNEIREILKNPQKVLSEEILKITAGGLPVVILCSKTCREINKVKEAIKELLRKDEIVYNPNPYMKQNEKFTLNQKDLNFLLNYIDKIFDIVKTK